MDSSVYVMKCMSLDMSTIKEVSILASLSSPYIVCYKDSFIEDDKLYLIMEYCERGDVKTLLASQRGIPLPEGKIWRIAIETLLGLKYLHNNAIIHRDIKPKNLLLSRDYHCKIADFGVRRNMT